MFFVFDKSRKNDTVRTSSSGEEDDDENWLVPPVGVFPPAVDMAVEAASVFKVR